MLMTSHYLEEVDTLDEVDIDEDVETELEVDTLKGMRKWLFNWENQEEYETQMFLYLNYPDLLPYWPRSSVGTALEDLIQRSWGSNPNEVKFSLTSGDSQISFKGVIPNEDLVYRQHCLLAAPKHILKIIIFHFPGDTRFPCYIQKTSCSEVTKIKSKFNLILG